MNAESKKSWSTKDAMAQIYERYLWGGKEFDFYSGEGSHQPKIVEPYIKAISEFLKSHNNNLTICDLGCGDFNIGTQILPYTKRYYAVDIVDSLIIRNKNKFKDDHLYFYCLDIANDDLPKANCAIVRQVLQHLSNKEVIQIVKKLYDYYYVIVTEHIPTGKFTPNKDIISGQGIRLKRGSGISLIEAPFNLKIYKKSELCKIVLDDHKSQIVTILYQLK